MNKVILDGIIVLNADNSGFSTQFAGEWHDIKDIANRTKMREA